MEWSCDDATKIVGCMTLLQLLIIFFYKQTHIKVNH